MLARVRSFLNALTRRDRFENMLGEELHFHLDAYAEDLMGKGMSRREAHRQARVQFGSVEQVRDECRQARGLRLIDDLGRDLRSGVRQLGRRPGFTAVAILSLALGIGANTAIFSFVNAIILRDVPIERPEEIVNIYLDQAAFAFSTLSYPDYEDLRDGTTEVFEQIGAMQPVPVQVERAGGVGMVGAEAVTGNYFPMLGIEAVVGRTLLPEDDVARGGHPIVMLNYGYWQSAFGGAPDIVGRELWVAGRTYTIVGVGPPTYPGSLRGLSPAFYAPYMMVEELLGTSVFDARGNHAIFAKARLKPGVTLPQAEAAVGAVAASLTEARLDEWDPAGQFVLLTLTEVLIHPSIDQFVRASAWLLMVVVGLVLLLACTNLASFLLARALDRRKDIAVLLALGASRGALVRRLLTETTLLSLLGGAAGIGLAVWLLDLLLDTDLSGPLSMQVTLDLGLDWTVLAFTLGISVVAGALLGLVPALQSTRPDVASTLKSDTAGGDQPGQLRWRNALVVTQLTVSVVLLVGAGLFLRSSQQTQAVDPGFGREPTAIMTFVTPATRFTEEEGRIYTRRLLDRFRQLPGVEAIGIIDNLHLSTASFRSIDFNVDGPDPPEDRGAFIADRAQVDAGFFEAAGIRIVRGRNFTDGDLPDSQPVAIISEAMAQRFWTDGDAVGRLVRRPGDADDDLLVVGVASDAKVRTLGEAPRAMVYLPYAQAYSSFVTVVARTSADPEQTALALMTVGRVVDPDIWVRETKSMDRHLAIMRLPAQLSAFVLSVFAVLALSLAGIGLYGVVSYAVAQRTREVGIRMALGADTGTVVRLLAGSGLRLVVVGGAIGLIIALAVTRLLRGLLFGIDTMDPMTFLAVPLVLGGTALLAAYLPARRASRVNPVTALRTE